MLHMCVFVCLPASGNRCGCDYWCSRHWWPLWRYRSADEDLQPGFSHSPETASHLWWLGKNRVWTHHQCYISINHNCAATQLLYENLECSPAPRRWRWRHTGQTGRVWGFAAATTSGNLGMKCSMSAEFLFILLLFLSYWRTIVGDVVGIVWGLIHILHFIPDLLCIVDNQLEFHNKTCSLKGYLMRLYEIIFS